jgi:hypothetical protein
MDEADIQEAMSLLQKKFKNTMSDTLFPDGVQPCGPGSG